MACGEVKVQLHCLLAWALYGVTPSLPGHFAPKKRQTGAWRIGGCVCFVTAVTIYGRQKSPILVRTEPRFLAIQPVALTIRITLSRMSTIRKVKINVHSNTSILLSGIQSLGSHKHRQWGKNNKIPSGWHNRKIYEVVIWLWNMGSGCERQT